MTSAPNDQLGDSSLNVLTAVSCGAMTVSWMIACASFTAAPLLGRRFSLADAAISFSSAAVAASWLRKLGGRNLLMAGLHTVVLTLLLAHALHKFFSPTAEFFDWGWIRALYGQMHRMPAFAAAALAAGWTAAFWAAGVKLGRRPLNYLTVCNRFDLGLTALFSLLLIQLVLVTRGGVSIAAPPEAHFVYGFFVCGLTAIGLARIRGTAAKRTLTGLRGVVILLVLSVTALATTGLLASLAPPILTPAAEDAYGALKIVAAPLGTMITRFLLFIFGREYDSPAAVGSAAGSTAVPVADPPGTWWIWLANLTARGLASLLALALLALSGYALWRLGQWLLQKKPARQTPSHLLQLLTHLLLWFLAWGRHVFANLARPAQRRSDIGRLFAELQTWGRLGGIGHHQWETPTEYADRLCRQLPETAADVRTIVEAYERKTYGEAPPDPGTLNAACSSWRRLRSPRHWPSRWRSLIDRPEAK